MNAELDTISQITIYLKGSEEAQDLATRVNEVALFGPLSRKVAFDEENGALKQRKWSFFHHLSFASRVFLKLQQFFYTHIPRVIPKDRKTAEAKFKTVLAILLAQEELREFFLGTEEKRRHFAKACQFAARESGYLSFQMPTADQNPSEIARKLTTLKKTSLIDNLVELNLQMASMSIKERNQILFMILNEIERPPLTSVLEVNVGPEFREIEMMTRYARVNSKIDDATKEIIYTVTENQTRASISSLKDLETEANEVMNQRLVFDMTNEEKPLFISGYSGTLSNKQQVIAQLILLLQIEEGTRLFLLECGDQPTIKKELLFTSLFSWTELDKILAQHQALQELNGKVLKLITKNGHEIYYLLSLYHQNIPFNALNRFPTPAETKATLKDINDESMISLTHLSLKVLNIELPMLDVIEKAMEAARREKQFYLRQKKILDEVDHFRTLKPEIVDALEKVSKDSPHYALGMALKLLLIKDHKKISGMDCLICTSLIMKHLNVIHNKNCEYSTDRSACANAADKAQNAFEKISSHPFIPQVSTEEEKKLFKVLYSMYLVWEEPELNSGLSTGFIGEKFFSNFIQKNPEATRYLISWLKKHPEMYQGLADYRF